ncbi:MAG: hypothetical protein ACR2NO_11400 [Chloroflexota bacterium]
MRPQRADPATLLGVFGLLAAGPLGATLLVGRTGIAPSVRWLGVAVATWVTLGALGWAVSRGRIRRGLGALAPVGAASPFLPWAYLDDRAFHAMNLGSTTFVACLAGLAMLGVGWQLIPANVARVESGSILGPSVAALVAPMFGVGLMFGLNDVLFEPLGLRGASAVAPLMVLAAIAPALVVAALIHFRLVELGFVAALAAAGCVTAAMASGLGVRPVGPGIFILATISLVPFGHSRFWRGFPLQLRPAAVALLALGFALASTQLARYGPAARELLAAAPGLGGVLPALGLVPMAALLALGAAAELDGNSTGASKTSEGLV